MVIDINISKRLKTLRKLGGLTQTELAKKISICRSMISMIEAGTRRATVEYLDSFQKALDITEDKIFDNIQRQQLIMTITFDVDNLKTSELYEIVSKYFCKEVNDEGKEV